MGGFFGKVFAIRLMTARFGDGQSVWVPRLFLDWIPKKRLIRRRAVAFGIPMAARAGMPAELKRDSFWARLQHWVTAALESRKSFGLDDLHYQHVAFTWVFHQVKVFYVMQSLPENKKVCKQTPTERHLQTLKTLWYNDCNTGVLTPVKSKLAAPVFKELLGWPTTWQIKRRILLGENSLWALIFHHPTARVGWCHSSSRWFKLRLWI